MTDVSVDLKPIQDSINENLKPALSQLSNSINEDLKSALSNISNSINEDLKSALYNISNSINISISASFASSLKNLKQFNSKIKENINSSISSSISEMLENTYKLSNSKQIDTIDSSELIEPIDTISKFITKDNFSQNTQKEILEIKQDIVSIKDSVELRSNNLTLIDYLTLICVIISTVFTVMSYYKPNHYEDKMLKALNEINSNVEYNLKVTK